MEDQTQETKDLFDSLDSEAQETVPKVHTNHDTKSNDLENIFSIIEDAFTIKQKEEQYAFPHPRNWLGPMFMALWVIAIFIINKLRILIKESNPVKPFDGSVYTITKISTIYTSTKVAFEGRGGIRFFGPRFLSIWVLPFAITGIVIDWLFVSPLQGVSPLN